MGPTYSNQSTEIMAKEAALIARFFLAFVAFVPLFMHSQAAVWMDGFFGGPGGVKRRRFFFFFRGMWVMVNHCLSVFFGVNNPRHPHGFVSLSIEVFIPINLRISRDLHIILNTSHSSNTTLGLEVCFCLPSPMFDPSDTTTTYFIWWPLRLVHLSSGWFCWSLDWTPPWPYSLARCTPTNTLMIQECTYDLVWCGFVGNTGKHTLHQANTLYINMLIH